MSLQTYVTQLLDEHVRRPTLDEWLGRLDGIDSVEDASGARAVAAARADLP